VFVRLAYLMLMVAGAMSARRPAPVFQRHGAPESRSVVVVRQTRSERVCLVHRSQESTGFGEVIGFGRESGGDGVCRTRPAQPPPRIGSGDALMLALHKRLLMKGDLPSAVPPDVAAARKHRDS
jgi:hypothetical protein